MSEMNISFRIQALDSFSSVFRSVDSQTRNLQSTVGDISAKLAGIGKGMAVAGTGMLAASSAALGVGLNYLAGMQSAQTGLDTLTGSADKTKSIMKDLQTFALKTPFDFPGMIAGERRLIGMGFAADDATGMLKAAADATAAVGGGSAELDGVITALGQMQAKGKISAEEMNQMSERGLPAWKLLGEQMGKTPAQLMDMAAKGKLLSKDALPALQKGFEQTFGGSAAKQADTFSGRLANMKENFAIFAGALAKPLFEPLSNAMGVINEKAQAFAQWFQSLPQPVQTLATAAMLLVPILVIVSGFFLMFVGMIPTLAAGFAALPAIVGAIGAALTGVVAPIALAIAAVVGIGIALVAAYNHVAWFRDMVNAAWAWIVSAWNTALTFISGIVQTVMGAVSGFIGQKLNDIKAFWDENGASIMRIVQIYFGAIQVYIAVIFGVIKTIFQTVWPIISGIVQVAWAVIQTIVGTTIDTVLGLISVAMSLLQGDWSGAWEKIKKTASDIWGKIEGYFEGIDLYQIGKDIIQGLLDGLSDMMTAVKKKVEKVAALIPKGLRDFLGVHSPSRVTMKIGEYTGQGFVIGMDDQLSQIKAASRNMAGAAVPTVPPVRTFDYAVQNAQATRQAPQAPQKVTIEVPLYLNGSEIARATHEDISQLMGGSMQTKLRLNGLR